MGKLYIIATEIRLQDHEQLRYIRFPLDGAKDFCYRSRTTYSGFVHSSKKRNYRGNELMYYCNHERDHITSADIFNKTCLKHGIENVEATLPTFNVGSVYEFYTLIGYDYKTKKWI